MPFANDFIWHDGTQNCDLKSIPFGDIAALENSELEVIPFEDVSRRRHAPNERANLTERSQEDWDFLGSFVTSLHFHEGIPPPKEYIPEFLS